MSKDVEFVVRTIADTVLVNEAYFSELDGVVGDGDFGYSIARGFEKVLGEWDNHRSQPAWKFPKKNIFLDHQRRRRSLRDDLGNSFPAGRDGRWEPKKPSPRRMSSPCSAPRSKESKSVATATWAIRPCWTALIPAVDALEKAFSEGKTGGQALEEAAVVARETAEATRPMLAKHGRAAYTGERSIGTLDAGAVAMAVLFEAVSKAWKE